MNPPHNEGTEMERRSFLKLVVAYLGGASQGTVGNYGTRLVDQLFSNRRFDCPGRESIFAGNGDILYHCFLRPLTGEARFFPAEDWTGGYADVRLSGGQTTYGHEASVCNYIEDFIHRDMRIEHVIEKRPAESRGVVSEIVIGSGASNKRAERYLGNPSDPAFEAGSCKLHFGIKKGTGVLRRKQYGKEIERDAHLICNRDGRKLYHPESQNQMQIDDYLLVTRVPGESPGASITIFSGLHGPGTRAAELLFSGGVLPLKELESLRDKIGFKLGHIPFFQAIFRAWKFERDLEFDNTKSDVATKLDFIEAVALHPTGMQ